MSYSTAADVALLHGRGWWVSSGAAAAWGMGDGGGAPTSIGRVAPTHSHCRHLRHLGTVSYWWWHI